MNTPKIRFKGFTDDWEQRKLSELTTMHARIGWQNLRTSEFLDSGDYMLITGTDFQEGVIDYSTCHYVEKERYDQDKNIQIKNGSILITKDGTLGKVAYVQGLMMPATLNAGVFNVTIKNENIMDGKYLFQYLKAPFLMDYVSKKATGGTIKHLNQSILVDFPVAMPKREEQVKISRYFTALDNLITLHQRKCDETKQLKKFMLQKMFPKNGEKNPEIRFEGFTDDWEQRKVGDQMYIKSRIGWQALTKQEYLSEGDYYLITGTDIDETTHRVDLKRSYYVSKERYEMDSKIQVKEGDIIVTKDGTIGKVAMVTGLDKPATLNSHLFVLRDMSGKLDNHFLLHILNSHMFNHFVKSTKTGSTLTGLPQKTFVEFAFSCPKYEEQKLLSNYFDRLDHLITLHQRKCEKLKELKKFMLQNMFV